MSQYQQQASFGGTHTGTPVSSLSEEALRIRERDIARREAELEHRERILVEKGAKGLNPPNWPPFRPTIYHDIEKEIPAGDTRMITRSAYFAMLISAATLLLNFIGDIISTSEGTLDTSGGQHIGIGIAYLIFGVPGGLYLWYLPLYRATKTGKSRHYYAFLFFFGISVCFFVWGALGIPGLGCSGFITMIKGFQAGKPFSGIWSLIMAAIWGGLAAYGIYLWKRVRDLAKAAKAGEPKPAAQATMQQQVAGAVMGAMASGNSV